MRVTDLIEALFGSGSEDLINDSTEMIIRNDRTEVLAKGSIDDIEDYLEYEIESFTWQDDGKIFVDVK